MRLRQTLLPCALGAAILCACPVQSAEPPTRLVVSEGRNIGYATVADALANLESQGLDPAPGPKGALTFVETDNAIAWSFVGKDDPAYPSAVRYVYTKSDGILHAELTILCEASAARCEKFHSTIRDNLAELSKRMAGDPSAQCAVSEDKMKCGADAQRKSSD